MASVEERLKLKRGQVDTWSSKEKLCLASCVARSGNQNWMSVSRSLRSLGAEPNRPVDWFSQKSCAAQYDNLLTQIETPKRKKRGADGSKVEGVETPAEIIVKHLTGERIEELRKMMSEARSLYVREKEELYLLENGLSDDKLDQMLVKIQEEKKKKEAEQEAHQQWIHSREQRKVDTTLKPPVVQPAAQTPLREVGGSARRPSNQSELGSETDNVESPSSSDQPTTIEEIVEPKPASTPTSPLLTSLLKSPSPVTGSQSSSILHSAITSQRGSSPTITSLLNSSPGVPCTNTSKPVSPNLKSLVSNTLVGHDDAPKQPSHGTSSSPTLSMLLELPPSAPGKLPELPCSASKQPAITPSSRPGEGEKAELEGSKPSDQPGTTLENVPDSELPEQHLADAEISLDLEGFQGFEPPEPTQSTVQIVFGVQGSVLSEQHQSDVEILHGEEGSQGSEIPEQCQSTLEPMLGGDGPKKEEHNLTPIEPNVQVEADASSTESTLPLELLLKTLKPTDENPQGVDTTPQTQPRESSLHRIETRPLVNYQVSVGSYPGSSDSATEDHSNPPEQSKVTEKHNTVSTGHDNIAETQTSTPLGNILQDTSKFVQNQDLPLQVSSSVCYHPGNLTKSPPAQVEEPDNLGVIANSEANAGGGAVDSIKKEPLLDIKNMEIVMSGDVETKAPEAGVKETMDESDLQHIPNDELEYVVDPSILQEVQEYVPEGLVDDMVFIVSSDDVETDGASMLETADGAEANAAEVQNKLDNQLNKDGVETAVEESDQDTAEVKPVCVVVHTPPVRQTPQQAVPTPSSLATSPRTSGRPAKGSMVARKIVMEEENQPNPDAIHSEAHIEHLEGDSETLDLQSAEIILMQDNGEVVGLTESGQTTSIENDIHVIQDSSSGSVVVVPHEDILKDSEVDSDQPTPSPTGNTLDEEVEEEQDVYVSPKKDEQLLERKSPIRSSRKNDENPIKKVDDSKMNPEVDFKLITHWSDPAEQVKSPPPQKDIVELEIQSKVPKTVDSVTEEEVTVKRNDPLSPNKHKLPAPSSKRDKSPDISESSNEVVSEEDSTKDESTEDSKKDDVLQIEEKETNQEKAVSSVQVDNEYTRHMEIDVHATRIKEEKPRSETPSTEDDNTRDTEPPVPVRRGRGRARESTTTSDSVPNSPIPTSQEFKAWKKSIMLVYNRIAQHKNASIFLKPVSIAGYTESIKRPLDLQTIKKNIELGKICSTDEFERDILLMFYNAVMFNKSDDHIVEMAREMQKEVSGHIEEYRNTQLYLQNVSSEGGLPPSRRGTRTAEKRDLESDTFSSRRGLSEKNMGRGVFSSNLLGKRKRSLPDDRSTPKRRKDED